MVSARASILIARPPERVFDFVAVDFFKNYRRWSPEVRRLDTLSPGPLRVGSLARQVRIDHGRRSETTFRVTVLEPPRQVEFAETEDLFRIGYLLDPVGSDPTAIATRFTLRFELTRLEPYMRPFSPLIRRAIRDGAEQVVKNIRGLAEREIPVGPTG